MATVISRPTIGSASGKPSATPPAPASTASEVKPSVRACKPSATRAAEPICRPTRTGGAGADVPAHADAVDGDQFVAEEADEPRQRDPAQLLNRGGVEQAADGLEA